LYIRIHHYLSHILSFVKPQEEQLQKELSTLRDDHAALRKTLEVQTEQSQALTTELKTIRENSSVDITEQIEKLCKISLERDEMQRKLAEAGNSSQALNDALAQV
jgi:predicted  nucleic acid-binding Zn-ribbon protein